VGVRRERGGLSGSGARCPERSKECAQCENGRSTEPLEHYRSTARYHTSTAHSGYYASATRYGGSTRVALCGVRRQHHGCRRSSARTPSSAVTCPFSCSTVPAATGATMLQRAQQRCSAEPAATGATTLQRTQQRCNRCNNAATDATTDATPRCNGRNSATTGATTMQRTQQRCNGAALQRTQQRCNTTGVVYAGACVRVGVCVRA
jgi:hypothetical protein